MSKFKPEQVLNYLLVEFGLSEKKNFDYSLLEHCREVCGVLLLDTNDTILIQRALIVEILGSCNLDARTILGYFETWIRAEYHAATDEEKQFVIAVQNALRDELLAKL